MILKINNKLFKGHYESNGIVIPLVDSDDGYFFHNWCQQCKITSKTEYCKTIEYYQLYESGILEGCFPIMNQNENWVLLIFDSKKNNPNTQ